MIDRNPRDLVSVIVPTYKRHDYLILTLNSILAQTHSRIEVLVVSDGDDSETERLVHQLHDKRLRYLSTVHAGFPAVPRNEGLRQAKGDLLAFCDDDDLWHPSKLELQIPILKSQQYSLCATDYDYIDSEGGALNKRNHYQHYYGEFNWRTFYHSMGFICNAAVLFTRRALDQAGFLSENPELRAHEDFEFWMRLLFVNNGFFMSDRQVSYRIHSGSIQKNTPETVFARRKFLLDHLSSILEIPKSDYQKKLRKLQIHYWMEKLPVFKMAVRLIQGRSPQD